MDNIQIIRYGIDDVVKVKIEERNLKTEYEILKKAVQVLQKEIIKREFTNS